jgi:hypothetical protein
VNKILDTDVSLCRAVVGETGGGRERGVYWVL